MALSNLMELSFVFIHSEITPLAVYDHVRAVDFLIKK